MYWMCRLISEKIKLMFYIFYYPILSKRKPVVFRLNSWERIYNNFPIIQYITDHWKRITCIYCINVTIYDENVHYSNVNIIYKIFLRLD